MSAPLEIVPLGGLGEFGRNLLWLKCGESSLLVDVGVSFPDETFPGIDRIAPDLSALEGARIDGVLLTHGHEDHIGALGLLREISHAPVYGFPFTLAMARRRLEEADAPLEAIHEIRPREEARAGEFRFTFFRVSHSVPDSAAILIEAGGRRIFHSGDFKLDPDPPDGETTDFEGIAKAVEGGIDLALVDSTNAERPGRAQSERVAGEGLAAAFAQAPRRIILTTFSSHVARISQSLDAAFRLRRSAAFLGRSMRSVVEIAQRLRRLSLPGGASIATSDLATFPPERLLCLTSGSQGEAYSALYRLALDEHADLKILPEDLVIFSARTIPGHERSVNRVTDHLVRRGARVLRETDPPVHVSGHAHRDDIADWVKLVRPRAVMPIHGERRMLVAAGDVAREGGIPADRIPLLDNGDRLTLSDSGLQIQRGAATAGRIYLDARPELVEASVVRDRRQLAEEGFVVVFIPADPRSGEITVVSRGVALAEAEIGEEVRRAARAVLASATPEERDDPEWLRAEITLAAKRACRRTFDLRPVIVPVIA
ncbi:MAG TPA: ribonuclease J [Thermoanaerobaculia bacterium]|nr:ribonuclease J [Thermoanaerobaculia bacterium]